MTDPDVRVVVTGLAAAERRLEQLRQRRRAERAVEEVRRALAKIDTQLARLERQLRASTR